MAVVPSSPRLAQVRDDLRQRATAVPLIFEEQQRTLEQAWNRQWTEFDVREFRNNDVAACMLWRIYSPLPNTTMFAHALVGEENYMFFHPNAPPSDETRHLATYLDFFVAAYRDGGLIVLSAAEWEASKRRSSTSAPFFVAAVVVRGTLLVERLARSERVPSMPRGYFDARYQNETDAARTALHTSRALIERVCAQNYEATEETIDTRFAFDRYPLHGSTADKQGPPAALCFLAVKDHGYAPCRRPPRSLAARYTATFIPFVKTLTIGDASMRIEDAIRRFFVNENYLPNLKTLTGSDANGAIPTRINEFKVRAREMYGGASQTLNKFNPYVSAACLCFLVALERNGDAFVKLDVEVWMGDLSRANFEEAVTYISLSNNMAANIFWSYLNYPPQKNRTLETWFVAAGMLPPTRHRITDNMPETFNAVKTYKGSLFSAREIGYAHVVETSFLVFKLLDVRINRYDDNQKDVTEKVVSACIEASLVMEVLFENAQPVSTPERTALTQCRAWIAAWLLAFKVLVHRNVENQRIRALLWHLREKNPLATNAERDANLFARLFAFSHVVVPRVVGALIPTLHDLRRHIDARATESPALHFPNIYDARLFWMPDADVADDDMALAAVKYPGDVSGAVDPQVFVGDKALSVNQAGDALSHVFAVFMNSVESCIKLRAFAKEYSDLITEATAPSDFHYVLEEVVGAQDRIVAFEHTSPSRSKLRRIERLVKKFERKFGAELAQIQPEEFDLVAWIAHSALMREQLETATPVQNVLVRRRSGQPGAKSLADQMIAINKDLFNPQNNGLLSLFNLGALDKVKTLLPTEAHIFNSDRIDVPVSYGGDVLARVGRQQFLEGFPLFERFTSDERILRLYNAYSDFVCAYPANADELYDSLLNTLNAQYREHYRLPPTARGTALSDSAKSALLQRLEISALFPLGYLARDIVNRVNSAPTVVRTIDSIHIIGQKHNHEGLLRYLAIGSTPVSSGAVDMLDNTEGEDAPVGSSTYSVAHYFKYATIADMESEATLLLRLVAAHAHGSWSALEYYAPIRGYVHAAVAGKPALPIARSNLKNNIVGDYLASTRGMSCALFPASRDTGRMPVADAFDRHGQRYQDTSAISAPDSCYVAEDRTLRCGSDTAESFGTLAAEVRRIEFVVYATRPTFNEVQEETAANLAASLGTAVFSPDVLYPVDEMAWFQFVEAVPIASIPASLLVAPELPQAPRAAPSGQPPKSQRRVSARINPEDPLEQRYLSLAARIGTYRAARNDINDPNFKRDFVDFYLRHVYATLGEDAFLGSTADAAAFVRYYGTQDLDERREEDLGVIEQFFEGEEDVRIMPSSTFPNWHVATFIRSANAVVVARYHGAEEASVYGMHDPNTAVYSVIVPTNAEPAYSFFAMLRYVELMLKRSDRLEALSEEELASINDDIAGYFEMLNKALFVLSAPRAEEPDQDHRAFALKKLTEDQKRALSSVGSAGYLYDDLLDRFAAWLHVTWSVQNPAPHRIFKIYSSVLSESIAAGETPDARSTPETELALYPWYNPKERHFYLVVIHYPTSTAFCLDSMMRRDRNTIAQYVKTIARQYRSISSFDHWNFVVPIRNVPKQPNAYQCGDFTMANVQYLIQWYMNDPDGFVESVRALPITRAIYTTDQVAEVVDLALTFRARVLELADAAETLLPPAIEVVVDDANKDKESTFFEIEDDPGSDDMPSLRVVENQSLRYFLQSEQARSEQFVYAACLVRGYELSARTHGNRLRYVRYGADANASFVKTPRVSRPLAENPELAYWTLRPTAPIADGAEIVVKEPAAGETWRRLLLTGYPYEVVTNKRERNSPLSTVGPTLGVGARLFPLVAKTDATYVLTASPLPLYRPRVVS